MTPAMSLLRAAVSGQWLPSCSSLTGMAALHRLAATAAATAYGGGTGAGVTQQQQQKQQQQQPWQYRQQWQQVRHASSTAAQPKQKQKQQQQQQKQAGASPPAAAAADPQQQHQQLVQLQQLYHRSRLLDFYNGHLSRELMLRLNVRSVQQLPRVQDVVLSVSSKDLHGKRYVEKWEMLLPALALEYITGEPAKFVHSTVKYYRNKNAVTCVKVRLTGRAALDLLEKLTYVVLPSQNGFSGISSRAFDKAGNLHFRVQRMANFPDFEEQFEIFEELGALHVSINMTNVSTKPGRSALLLSGLQLPIISKDKGAAAAGADESATAAAAEGDSSDGDFDSSGEEE